MKIEELYNEVKVIVISETGIEELLMLRSRKESCVDARYLLVYFLAQKLTDDDISLLIGYPRQAVNHMRNNFQKRTSKWSVRRLMESISAQLADNERTIYGQL